MTRLRLGILGNGNVAHTLQDEIRRSRPYDVVACWGRDDLVDPAGIDLVVEVAAPGAVRDRVLPLIAEGVDALVLSVGALVDAGTRSALLAGPGRAAVSTGAIGGLDHLRAMRLAGPLTSVQLETRKLPATLIQPWMDDALVARLRAGEEIVLMDADAATVARAFPRSANVAASVALAADGWDVTRARVIADPRAALTSHTVAAHSEQFGECRFAVHNAPSPERPRSSAIVVPAVLRGIDDHADAHGLEAPRRIRFL